MSDEERRNLREKDRVLVELLDRMWTRSEQQIQRSASRVIYSVFLAVGLGVGATSGMVYSIRATAHKQARITRVMQQQVEITRRMVEDLMESEKVQAARYKNLLNALESARQRLDAAGKAR